MSKAEEKTTELMKKAKAYDEAIERAKKWYNAPNVDKISTFGNRIIEEIFPELKEKESEDERIRKFLIGYFDELVDENSEWGLNQETRNKIVAWLKSLRPQSKNEWDKNDELNRQDTIRLLTDAKERYLQTDASIPKCIKWLENLSSQSHWKPSEEQMVALKEACDEHWEPDGIDILYTLWEQLKAL